MIYESKFASIEAIVRLLIQVDVCPNSYLASLAPNAFEQVVCGRLVSSVGADWVLRESRQSFGAHLTELSRVAPSRLQDMQTNVLYYPDRANHPLCAAFYLEESGAVVCLQISRSSDATRVIEGSAYKAFLKTYKMDATTDIRVIYCPPPKLAAAASLSFGEGCPELAWDVLVVPRSYRKPERW